MDVYFWYIINHLFLVSVISLIVDEIKNIFINFIN